MKPRINLILTLRFTDEEVRLLIDGLKGEEHRLQDVRRDEGDLVGDWLQRRLDAVEALHARLQAART